MPFKRGVGFFNRYRVDYEVFNVGDLAESQIEEITPELMREAGLIKNLKRPVKILGNGEVDRPLKITAHKFSAAHGRRSKPPAARSASCPGPSYAGHADASPVVSSQYRFVAF
jgi:large subunit ribosomal protein L15